MKSTLMFIVSVVFIVGCVNCQNSNELDINDLKEKLHEQGLPDSINENATQQVENAFKEKCEKQGAGDVVDTLKNQQDFLKDCITQHVNVSVLKEELEVAKETGSMDEVFAKYCRKWPDIYKCVENVTDLVRSCMSHEEKVAFNKSLDIGVQLQEFMCTKDGDRLAMFVAEGGVECMNERQEQVKKCVNSTIGDRLPTSTDGFTITHLPSFLFSERDCSDFDTIRICVNKELEECANSTPANIVDAFLKFLKKNMPCKARKMPLTEAITGNSTSSSVHSRNFALMGVPSLLFVLTFRSY